jgi:predicted amidophosphoribosyltransferase
MVSNDHELIALEDQLCASCGEWLNDQERTEPVCWRCDEKLERELTCYMEFIAVSREST